MARKNRTFYIDDGIGERVKQLAAAYDVTVADVANFLLLYALNEVESGRVCIPTRPGRALVDWEKVGRR